MDDPYEKLRSHIQAMLTTVSEMEIQCDYNKMNTELVRALLIQLEAQANAARAELGMARESVSVSQNTIGSVTGSIVGIKIDNM